MYIANGERTHSMTEHASVGGCDSPRTIHGRVPRTPSVTILLRATQLGGHEAGEGAKQTNKQHKDGHLLCREEV